MANSTNLRLFLLVLVWVVVSDVCSGQRDVQFSAIRFNEGDAIIEGFELTNYGTSTEDMSSWQFCSHDADRARVYGRIGGSIAPGETKLLFARDFTLATPFSPETYSLQIFDLSAGGFGGTTNIVDHLQWSIGGVHNTTADARSAQAVTGGLWTSATDWISTTADTSIISLKESSQGNILHGPDDYEVITIPPFSVPCDLDGDGDCDADDLDALFINGVSDAEIENWLSQASDFDAQSRTFKVGDINLDGTINSADLGLLLNNFGNEDNPVYSAGNLNGDSSVNSSDLGLVLNNFGFESAELAVVPEPAALSLIAFACTVLLCRRRRHLWPS